MTLEEAIRTAIDYETKVRNLYHEATAAAGDETGRKIFATLEKEEQGHLDYLDCRLAEWQKDGKVVAAELDTLVPSPDRIQAGLQRLKKQVNDMDYSRELEMLRRALQVEKETGDFYRRMVDELGPEGLELFHRFMEIEDGHYAIVQAQIDALNGMGYWFDFMEFNLEAG